MTEQGSGRTANVISICHTDCEIRRVAVVARIRYGPGSNGIDDPDFFLGANLKMVAHEARGIGSPQA